MRDVVVLGVGMHPFGKFMDKSLKELAYDALSRAIDDAGVSLRDIQTAYVSNAYAGLMTGQESIRGQVVLRYAGFSDIPIVNVENACAGGATAFREAWLSVASGLYDMALAIGVEKLYCDDTARSIRAIASSSDVDLMAGLGFQFSANYAMGLRKQMAEYGWTQQDFARAAVKNKRHGSLNPNAQFRTPVTEEDVLSSRLVAWPLTLYMCSSIGDGAAAAILCSAEVAARYRPSPYVQVAACALRSAPFEDYRQPPSQPKTQDPKPQSSAHWLPVAREAYERAGLGPQDVHVAEVHDAMAPAELRLYHALGFCDPGEGARLLAEGATAIEGRLPVNPSGGLSARGHPVGATGLAQIAEIVWQLRGEAGPRQAQGPDGHGPRVGLAQNSGGNIEGHQAVTSVIILAR